MNRPPLIALIYRQRTGCRQYAFETVEQIKQFTKRYPYRTETIRVMPVNDREILGDAWIPAGEAAEFVRVAIAKAPQKQEAAA